MQPFQIYTSIKIMYTILEAINTSLTQTLANILLILLIVAISRIKSVLANVCVSDVFIASRVVYIILMDV